MTWPFTRRDALIDGLIKTPIVKFDKHDEALERRSRSRREQAEKVRAQARRIEVRDDPASQLHIVGRDETPRRHRGIR